MRLVIGRDAAVADWVGTRIPHVGGGGAFGPCAALGVEGKSGALIGGVVFSNWQPSCRSIEASFASDTPRWLTRGLIAQIMAYPFDQLGCQRVTAITPRKAKAARRFLDAFGFKREGLVRKGFGDDDAVVSGLLRREGRGLAGTAAPAPRRRQALAILAPDDATYAHLRVVRIVDALLASLAGSDGQEAGWRGGAIDQVVGVGFAGGKANGVAGRQRVLAVVVDQHELAEEDVDQLILVLVPVPESGIGAGLEGDVVHAELAHSHGPAELALVSSAKPLGPDRIGGGEEADALGQVDEAGEAGSWHGASRKLADTTRDLRRIARP